MLNKNYNISRFILRLPRYVKRSLVIILDVGICVFTVWLAFYLRLGEFVLISHDLVWATGLSLILAMPIFLISRLYQAIFRYSGFPAIFVVARSIFIYAILYGTTISVITIENIPRTIGLIQPLLLLFGVGGSRLLIQFWLGERNHVHLYKKSISKVLIYGAGRAGRQLVSALQNNYDMKVIGYLDDDDRLHGSILNDQQIFSPNDIENLIISKSVTHVLLAIPSASQYHRRKIIKKLSTYQLVVRTLPSFSDIAEGRITVSDIQDLNIEDLLGRAAVSPNQNLLAKNISNNIVMVTGAGGSIGSELCRQIFKLKPKKIILVELNEYALYTIQTELESMQKLLINNDVSCIVPLLASVQDENRISKILDTWQPDIIYHAAAYKHVPLVEYNLSEGVKNNVLGSLVLARAAIKNGVSDFVMISTDKAVRPTNAMGASKRLAEMSLQALFANTGQDNKTKISMVRFGNVLNSSGSVIPLFKNQIHNGGPVTLTHNEITRYFMTISEAAELVIQAGAMAKGGDVFVLDMGLPVKIFELAKRMITLSGLKIKDKSNPEGDIEITIIGLRPGEKLYEELLLGDNPLSTAHPKILRAQDPFLAWTVLEQDLQKLITLLNNNDVEAVVTLLKKLVPEYHPSFEITDGTYLEQNGSKLN